MSDTTQVTRQKDNTGALIIDSLVTGFQFRITHVSMSTVSCLEALSDESLFDYISQLVQALKHERTYASDLARFLVRRSLRQRATLGQRFFWLLWTERSAEFPQIGLLLEAYLRSCGEQRDQLIRQVDFALKV